MHHHAQLRLFVFAESDPFSLSFRQSVTRFSFLVTILKVFIHCPAPQLLASLQCPASSVPWNVPISVSRLSECLFSDRQDPLFLHRAQRHSSSSLLLHSPLYLCSLLLIDSSCLCLPSSQYYCCFIYLYFTSLALFLSSLLSIFFICACVFVSVCGIRYQI